MCVCVLSVHEVWDESRRTRLLSLSPCRTLQTLSPPPVTRNLILLVKAVHCPSSAIRLGLLLFRFDISCGRFTEFVLVAGR